MSTKGQVSMEFLLLVSFLFTITFGFILVASIQMADYADDGKKTKVNDFGGWLKSELSIAAVVHEGYERRITLPDKIDSMLNYSLAMSNGEISITSGKFHFSSIIPKTVGELKKGENIVKNINGTVTIENV